MIAIGKKPQTEGMTLEESQRFPPVPAILVALGLLFLTSVSLTVLLLPAAQALAHSLLQTVALERLIDTSSDRVRHFAGWTFVATFVAIIVFAAEILGTGWSASSIRRMLYRFDGSQRTDLLLFLAYAAGLMPALITVFSLGGAFVIGQAMQVAVRNTTGLNLRVDTGSGVCNFTIYYLVYSFLEYWNHRFFHMRPLWFLHRLHHSATSLNPLVTHRNNPVQHALEPLILNWPAALIAAPGGAITLLFVMNYFYQLLAHADVSWTWGWFGRWVLISPAAHRIHHSTRPEHYGKNLSVLTIWDRLFGTWYDGDAPVERLGIEDATYNSDGLIADCIRDLRLFVQDLAAHFRR